MTDVTLSLGGRWQQDRVEREQQGAMIAHLTNQLEGLRCAYTEDEQHVRRHKEMLVELQAELDKTTAERDNWQTAYNGIIDKRIERDHLVEDMLAQLRTLEETTRTAELEADEAKKAATMLQKEKELLAEKLDKTKKELDSTYTQLARTSDDLTTATDSNTTLTASLTAMTRSRDSKEVQVVSILKEKNRLFRLVTDLRSTMKGTAAAKDGHGTPRSISGQAGSASVGDLEDAVAADLSAADAHSSRRGSVSSSSSKKKSNRWASAAPSLQSKVSNAQTITSSALLDQMSHSGSAANLRLNFTGLVPSSRGSSRHTTPKSSGRGLSSSRALSEADDAGSASDASIDSIEQRTTAAKANLVQRLKRQIALLEEKCAEQEKAIGMTRSENQLLLVRFRGAHDRRLVAEKKLHQADHEIEELRRGGGSSATSSVQGDVIQQQQIYEEQPRQRQRPTTPGAPIAPATPARWK